jgi:hypothetical protein
MSSPISSRRVKEQHQLPHLEYSSPPSRPSFPQHSSQTRAGPSYESASGTLQSQPSQQKSGRLRGLRPWSFSSRSGYSGSFISKPVPAGKVKADTSADGDYARALQSYEQLRIADPIEKELPRRPTFSLRGGHGQGWPESEDEGPDNEPDSYSWVDSNDEAGQRPGILVRCP